MPDTHPIRELTEVRTLADLEGRDADDATLIVPAGTLAVVMCCLLDGSLYLEVPRGDGAPSACLFARRAEVAPAA